MSYESGELLRIVAATLIARGLQVQTATSAGSRRLTVTVTGGDTQASRDSEVVVEDDGYIEWRYWPAAGRPVDPARIAGIIADLLSADISAEGPADTP
jgi:hypothetical protein